MRPFAIVSGRTGTPLLGTVAVGAVVIVGALALPVAALAEATAAVLLAVFFLVNAALILLKSREPEAPFLVPIWVPVSGVILALGALILTSGKGV